jgi:hypothetical protein
MQPLEGRKRMTRADVPPWISVVAVAATRFPIRQLMLGAGSPGTPRRGRPNVRRGAAVAMLVGLVAAGCQPTTSQSEGERPAAAEHSDGDPFSKRPDQITWLEPPPDAGFLPDGVQIALIEGGSPLDKGPFTFRLRFPAGSRLMPHTHPTADRITVISGTLHHGKGRTFDQGATEAAPPGTFVYHPGGAPHYVWFDEETVLQFHGEGPFGISYLNEADDPRNQK